MQFYRCATRIDDNIPWFNKTSLPKDIDLVIDNFIQAFLFIIEKSTDSPTQAQLIDQLLFLSPPCCWTAAVTDQGYFPAALQDSQLAMTRWLRYKLMNSKTVKKVLCAYLPVVKLLLPLAEQVPVQGWVLEEASQTSWHYWCQITTIATSLSMKNSTE